MVVSHNYATTGDVGVVRLTMTVKGVDEWGMEGTA